MTVFENELIFEKILRNLSGKDLSNVRLVCKRWQLIADDIISKRHSDNFTCMYIPYRVPKRYEKMINVGRLLESPADHFYFRHKNDGEDFSNVFHHFLLTHIASCPGVAINFIEQEESPLMEAYKLMGPVSFPIVLLEGGVRVISLIAWRDKTVRSLPKLFRLFGISFPNRGFTDLKVIVTDWDWSQSVEPDIDDVDYPVRCIMLYCDADHVYYRSKKRFRDFLSTLDERFPLCGFFSNNISYYMKERERFHQSRLLTITFAGKHIKAQGMRIDSEFLSTDENLVIFKSSLPFDPDQSDYFGHTIGFVFWPRDYEKETVFCFVQNLCRVFPSVKFTFVQTLSRRSFESFIVDNKSKQKLDQNYSRTYSHFCEILVIHFGKS